MSVNLSTNNRLHDLKRGSLLTLLLAFWLFIGYQENLTQQFIAQFFQEVFVRLGISSTIYDAGDRNRGYTNTGFRLVFLSYGLLYGGLGLLIIRTYFRKIKTTRLALGLYGILILFTVIINETGKQLAFEPFRMIAHRLMNLVNSPMPFILLFSALYFMNAMKETTQKLRSN